MKVLDLQCAHAHDFEGWFASEDDFQSQLARGLVTCPLCGSADVRKLLSAPRLNLHTTRGDLPMLPSNVGTPSSSSQSSSSSMPNGEQATAHNATSSNEVAVRDEFNRNVSNGNESNVSDVAHALASMSPQQMQAAWLHMTRHVLAHTEDVGDQFADQARRMHHGEVAQRNIRGQATAEETQELLEEGISVLPLVIPEALKGPVQ